MKKIPQWQTPVEQPETYEVLSQETKDLLQAWISWAFWHSKTIWQDRTSYGLKHDLEFCTGVYVTNGQFKGAMLAAGYEPVDRETLNWKYRARFTRPAKEWYRAQYNNRDKRRGTWKPEGESG